MNPLSEGLKEMIRIEAEQEAGGVYVKNHMPKVYIDRCTAYTAAATKYISEHMPKILEWAYTNYKMYQYGLWRKPKELVRFTTTELIDLYFKTKQDENK